MAGASFATPASMDCGAAERQVRYAALACC